jgi:hypothetical protein
MADIKKLYIDLITDYDPYTDINELLNSSPSEMLYNMIEIQRNNIESIDDEAIVNRFNTLIELFKALGIK